MKNGSRLLRAGSRSLSSIARVDVALPGQDDRRHDIEEQAHSPEEGQGGPEQADDAGVQAELLGDAAADPRQHGGLPLGAVEFLRLVHHGRLLFRSDDSIRQNSEKNREEKLKYGERARRAGRLRMGRSPYETRKIVTIFLRKAKIPWPGLRAVVGCGAARSTTMKKKGRSHHETILLSPRGRLLPAAPG